MDEPLSNLDAKLRVSMRGELARLHERLGVTTVYVTHDQVEAMTLGQRVAVLRDGVLQQVDTPQTLFNAAGEPVRGRVHRLAVDEPGRGRRRRRRRSASAATSSRCRRDPTSARRPRDRRDPADRLRAHARRADPALPRMRVRADVVEELGAEIARDLPDRRPAGRRRGGRAAADTGRRRRRRRCSPTTSARSSPRASTADSRSRPGDEVELAVDTRRPALLRPRDRRRDRRRRAARHRAGAGRDPLACRSSTSRSTSSATYRSAVEPHRTTSTSSGRGDRRRARGGDRADARALRAAGPTASSTPSTSRSAAPTETRCAPGTSARRGAGRAASVPGRVRRLRRRPRPAGGARALPGVRLRNLRHGHARAGRDLVGRGHRRPRRGRLRRRSIRA